MKLYYSPGACSLAPHIVLCEAGLRFETEQVDLAEKKTATGGDYTKINPKGYVPALILDDGSLLTEAGVVVQYIADQKPEAGLAPKPGTMARYHYMEWINFIATEIHKGFGPLWNAQALAQTKDAAKIQLGKRFAIVEAALTDRAYLTGDIFSAADAYLFTTTNWSHMHHIDLGPWPKLRAFMSRVLQRPKVQEAMKAEGLIQ